MQVKVTELKALKNKLDTKLEMLKFSALDFKAKLIIFCIMKPQQNPQIIAELQKIQFIRNKFNDNSVLNILIGKDWSNQQQNKMIRDRMQEEFNKLGNPLEIQNLNNIQNTSEYFCYLLELFCTNYIEGATFLYQISKITNEKEQEYLGFSSHSVKIKKLIIKLFDLKKKSKEDLKSLLEELKKLYFIVNDDQYNNCFRILINRNKNNEQRSLEKVQEIQNYFKLKKTDDFQVLLECFAKNYVFEAQCLFEIMLIQKGYQKEEYGIQTEKPYLIVDTAEMQKLQGRQLEELENELKQYEDFDNLYLDVKPINQKVNDPIINLEQLKLVNGRSFEPLFLRCMPMQTKFE